MLVLGAERRQEIRTMFYAEPAPVASSNRVPGPQPKELDASSGISREKPSKRMLRTWVKKVAAQRADTFPVYVNGSWTLQVFRGKKRMLSLKLGETLD
jgi:hypothetical protein